MNIFRSMDISASALTAQRYRTDIIAENIANATTTRTENGTPYRRKYVIFEERGQAPVFSKFLTEASARYTGYAGAGVRVIETREDASAFKLKYDPEHPDADENGYVSLPNVDIEREMVDFMSATRSYEANITAINNFKAMANRALQIGR